MKKNKSIPELRFPEFRNSGEWEQARFEEITIPAGERNKHEENLPVYSINNISGFLPQSEQFAGIDSKKRGYDLSLYKVVGSNTFAYNPARINVGSIGYSHDLDRVLISSLYVCFKTTENIEDLFLLHFLNTNLFSESVSRNVEGGIRSYLFYENLSRIRLSIPPSKKEQQKIADCLSSLDDLLKAETEKLEALRAHKKGLMQQLFPAEGARTPAFRFPEFRGSGDWEEKRLGEVAQFAKGKGVSKSDIVEDGLHPCIRYGELYTFYGEVIDNIRSRTNSPKEELMLSNSGDVILPSSGETKEDIATASCVLVDDVALGSDLNIVRSSINGIYLAYYLSNVKKKEISKIAQGDAVVHLYSSQLQLLLINFPADGDEQRKIANCLLSVDTLMKQQTIKLEQLRLHKKGLMQGLFPSSHNQ